MNKAQRDAISSPATGLLIYQTDNTPGFYFYNGSNWVVVGSEAMDINSLADGKTGGHSVYLGTGAGAADGGSNNYNVSLGDSTLAMNTTGYFNIATGPKALRYNTTGDDNTATGALALRYNTIGNDNTATGSVALRSNTEGSHNTATGSDALRSNTTGELNTATGAWALSYNTTGEDNTATGQQALMWNTTGSYNTAIGAYTLFYNETGTYNTAIGYSSGPTSGNDTLNNTTALGNGATVTASNTIHIGNTGIGQISGQVGWSTYSDKRFKTNVRQNISGLDFIMKLEPVSYQWDVKKLDNFLGIPDSIYSDDVLLESRDKQEQIIYTGFIAQDVEEAASELGFDFSGVVPPSNEQSVYSVRYAEFVVPLVKAVQEQQEMIEEQQEMIKELMERMERLEEKKGS